MSHNVIDVRSLKRIVALARTGSFTRAAERLGVSQSVLTRHIQDIERSIGARLFDRDKSGITLTAIGRDIVNEASPLLHNFDAFADFVDGVVSGRAGRVAIGVAPAIAPALLPAIGTGLLLPSSAIEGHFPVQTPDILLRMLLDDEIDTLVCPGGSFADRADLRFSTLGDMAISLLVRAGHPLNDALQQAEPGDGCFPLVSTIRYDPDALFSDHPWAFLRERPKLVVADHECLAVLTQESDAVWVTSTLAGRRHRMERRLLEVPAPPGYRYPRSSVMACHRRRRKIGAATEAILTDMRSLIRQAEQVNP
jgi:DNA-binding transcriptional LysR family regulator